MNKNIIVTGNGTLYILHGSVAAAVKSKFGIANRDFTSFMSAGSLISIKKTFYILHFYITTVPMKVKAIV